MCAVMIYLPDRNFGKTASLARAIAAHQAAGKDVAVATLGGLVPIPTGYVFLGASSNGVILRRPDGQTVERIPSVVTPPAPKSAL